MRSTDLDPEATPKRRLRFLILDPDAGSNALIRLQLKQRGIGEDVATESDPARFVAVARIANANVFLIATTGYDSDALLEQLKAEGVFMNAVVVLLAPYWGCGNRPLPPCWAYLAKPISCDGLVACIEGVFGEMEQWTTATVVCTGILGAHATEQSPDLFQAVLELYRRLAELSFHGFGGQVLKSLGHEFLVQFRETVPALRCSIEIHRLRAAYSREVAVERRFSVATGIHRGALVAIDGEPTRDTTYFACCGQSCAGIGGILVTDAVATQIDGERGFQLGPTVPVAIRDMPDPPRFIRLTVSETEIATE